MQQPECCENKTIDNISELEKLAEKIHKQKDELRQRRPIVIEFCGSPKSGKTSCINSLNLFLKRNGFKTGVITEQASVCPIKDKHNPAFNIWTVNSAISELNSLLDPRRSEPLDIVICDRAVFDALCWFEWLNNMGTLAVEEYNIITKYITLPRWSNKIDLVYVFKADPNISIEREYAHLLTRKPGSIMNQRTLSEYVTCIEAAQQDFGNKFRMIQEIDTSKMDQNQVSSSVTHTVLKKLEELLIERVGYIPKNVIKGCGLDCTQWQGTQFVELSTNIELDQIKFEMRNIVEANNTLLQIIPIGIITNPEHSKVLVLKKQKSASNGSPEKGAFMIWSGGHMREEDLTKDTPDFISLAKQTLRREIDEELGLSVCLDDINPQFIYSTDYKKSRNHLPVCFIIEKDLDSLSLSINSDELMQNRGKSKSGLFISVDKFRTEEYSPVEPWSRFILSTIFQTAPIDSSEPIDQITLLDT